SVIDERRLPVTRGRQIGADDLPAVVQRSIPPKAEAGADVNCTELPLAGMPESNDPVHSRVVRCSVSDACGASDIAFIIDACGIEIVMERRGCARRTEVLHLAWIRRAVMIRVLPEKCVRT